MEPIKVFLCESKHLILRPDVPYIFTVGEGCKECAELAAEYEEAAAEEQEEAA